MFLLFDLTEELIHILEIPKAQSLKYLDLNIHIQINQDWFRASIFIHLIIIIVYSNFPRGYISL